MFHLQEIDLDLVGSTGNTMLIVHAIGAEPAEGVHIAMAQVSLCQVISNQFAVRCVMAVVRVRDVVARVYCIYPFTD